MNIAVRPKVVVKVMPSMSEGTNSRPSSRPPSPIKHQRSTDGSEASKHFRPKARVNSSATIVTGRKVSSVVSTTSRPSRNGQEASSPASTTPRPRSPARASPHPRNGPLSPPVLPKLRNALQSGLRPRTPDSTPTTPESRQRSSTATTPSSETAKIYNPRPRQPSLSLHHAISLSSFTNSRPASPASSLGPEMPHFDMDTSIPPTAVRITSRVSVVKSITDSLAPSPSPTPTPLPITRTGSLRHRAPSASSTASFTSSGPSTLSTTQSPQAFYPITTSVPAANPYRFQPARPILRATSSTYTLQQRDDNHTTYTRPVAKVDPASIPLPPQSPPTSAVSHSSRSSVSRSSLSQGTADSGDSHSGGSTHQNDRAHSDNKLHSAIDTLFQFTSTVEPQDADFSEDDSDNFDANVDTIHERKVKAAAKSDRKIADLEITNRSLLAINSTLETTKHRQAKEIRELKRKLRESRLILPPRKYREVKSSLDHDDTEEEDDDVDGDGDGGDGKEEEEEDHDETYKRIKVMLEGLIQFGRTALEAEVVVPPAEKPVAKVLSAEEVQTWRHSSGRTKDGVDVDDDKGDLDLTTANGSGRLSRSSSTSSIHRLSHPLNDQTSSSRPQSPSPSILITEPV